MNMSATTDLSRMLRGLPSDDDPAPGGWGRSRRVRLLPYAASSPELMAEIRRLRPDFRGDLSASPDCLPESELLGMARDPALPGHPHLEACLRCKLAVHDYGVDLGAGLDPDQVLDQALHGLKEAVLERTRPEPASRSRLPSSLPPLPLGEEAVLYHGRRIPLLDLEVGQLLELVVHKHALPVLDDEGALLSYRVFCPRIERFLGEEESLGGAGVAAGDTLTLFPERLRSAEALYDRPRG